MKKLLVTGASGFLGGNVCQRAKREWLVFGTIFSHPVTIEGGNILKVDLTDLAALEGVFQAIRHFT